MHLKFSLVKVVTALILVASDKLWENYFFYPLIIKIIMLTELLMLFLPLVQGKTNTHSRSIYRLTSFRYGNKTKMVNASFQLRQYYVMSNNRTATGCVTVWTYPSCNIKEGSGCTTVTLIAMYLLRGPSQQFVNEHYVSFCFVSTFTNCKFIIRS